MNKEKVIGICKFCNTEKQLCDAHIVPKSFYKKVKHKLVLEDKHYTPNLWQGIYDKKILCKTCDGAFGEYENYAKNLLLDNLVAYKDSCKAMYFIPESDFDYQQFRMFIIFLIWKASISKEDYCKNVYLGLYEVKALEILKGLCNHDECFGFAILKNANLEFKDLHIPPTPMRYAGVMGYHFIFSGFSIYIIPNYKSFLAKRSVLDKLFVKQNEGLTIIETDDPEMTGMKHVPRIMTSYIKIKNRYMNLK